MALFYMTIWNLR